MKQYGIVSVLALVCVIDLAASQCAFSTDRKLCYTDRYDNVNVDAVLASNRLLKRYVDCLMDRGICTREGLFLKEVIPDVLQTECSKCNDYQKQIAGKMLSFMLQNQRGWWNELLEKYDKVGLFRKKYGIDENDEDYDDEDVKTPPKAVKGR